MSTAAVSSTFLPPPRLFAHVCDVTCQPLQLESSDSKSATDPTFKADIMTLLFCLSAMAPDRMEYAIGNMTKCLKVGGIILFRDYGRYDQAQLQLAKQQEQLLQQFGMKRRKTSSRLKQQAQHSTNDDNEQQQDILDDTSYIKQDGTSCYYFTLEEIQQLFEQYGGCQVLQLQYLQRVYINRATQQPRRRVWIQGRFIKTKKNKTNTKNK
jgi:methyltransferase-like protein 6